MYGLVKLLAIGAVGAIAACQSVPDPGDLSHTATLNPVVRFTPWPAGQEDLLPGPSSSLTKAPSLAGIAIQAPSAKEDPKRTAYLGEWRGWMCIGRTYDVTLAITKLAGSRVAFTFGWASRADGVRPQQSAMHGLFLADDLVSTLSKTDFIYGVNMRLREDGALDFQRIGLDGVTECFGALERVRGAPALLQPKIAPEIAQPQAADTSLELVNPPGSPPRSLTAHPPDPSPSSR